MTGSSKRILVIDDDAFVRETLVVQLLKAGYEVHDEANALDGLRWFSDNRPDLVLTDLLMPDIDGLTLLSRVKEIDPLTPVIVISGIGMVDDVAEALRLGASDYLVKPVVDSDVLAHSVKKSLEVLELQRQNLSYRKELEAANRELRDYVRVLERDQQAGLQVQTNLLPKSPKLFDTVNLSHRIIPSLYLSGDFIDYGWINDRYISFYLTDVSGHGASSAFVTVWLKQLVSQMVRERRIFHQQCKESSGGTEHFEIDAAEWVAIINEAVLQSRFGCHLTCFVGILDLQTLRMQYVLAGHLPHPLLVHEGKARYLEGKGKPVGIFKGAQWDVYQAVLPRGSSLVVFSDGVLEILPAKELIAKEEHLLQLMGESSGDMNTICSSLGLADKKSTPDDIAILTLNIGALQ